MRLQFAGMGGGLGVMVNVGGGTMEDLTPAQASYFWAAGSQQPAPGVLTPIAPPPLPKIPQPFSGPTNPQFVPSLSPGMANPVMAPTLDTYLQDLLAHKSAAGNVQTLVSAGGNAAQRDVQDVIASANQYCSVHPDVPGCGGGGTALAQGYAQRYSEFLAGQPASAYVTGAPSTSVLTGRELGYTYTTYAPGSIPTTSGGQNILNQVAPQAGSPALAQFTSVLNPPTGGAPFGPSALQNTQNVGAGPGLIAAAGAAPGGGIAQAPVGAKSWIEENWVLLAAAAGALFLMTQMGKTR